MKRGDLYPSWRYHADGRSVLCRDAASDAELGDDWSDEDIRLIGDRAPVSVETSEPPALRFPLKRRK